jgi:hypothetical protein
MERKTELAARLMRFFDNISEWQNFLNQVAKTDPFQIFHAQPLDGGFPG